MDVRQIVGKVIEPIARKTSAAITMRLVGYAIVRSVVGHDGLMQRPWSMSRAAVYQSEAAVRKYFGMSSAEFVAKYLQEIGAQQSDHSTS